MSSPIDLDALLPTDKTVKIAGATYTVPGDLPIKTYLRMHNLGSEDDKRNETQILDEIIDALIELVLWLIPETQRGPHIERLDKYLRNLGLGTVNKLLAAIYPPDVIADKVNELAGGADPSPATLTV